MSLDVAKCLLGRQSHLSFEPLVQWCVSGTSAHSRSWRCNHGVSTKLVLIPRAYRMPPRGQVARERLGAQSPEERGCVSGPLEASGTAQGPGLEGSGQTARVGPSLSGGVLARFLHACFAPNMLLCDLRPNSACSEHVSSPATDPHTPRLVVPWRGLQERRVCFLAGGGFVQKHPVS